MEGANRIAHAHYERPACGAIAIRGHQEVVETCYARVVFDDRRRGPAHYSRLWIRLSNIHMLTVGDLTIRVSA